MFAFLLNANPEPYSWADYALGFVVALLAPMLFMYYVARDKLPRRKTVVVPDAAPVSDDFCAECWGATPGMPQRI